MKRTAWATLAMSIAFTLGTIIAVGSLVSMGGKMDTARLSAAPLSAPTVLITCLDPLAILLEIAAIVLIVLDSRKVGGAESRPKAANRRILEAPHATDLAPPPQTWGS